MDDKKIAIIMSVNNELYFSECCAYIDKLTIPNGYDVELFPVRDAESMCQAYNIGMEASDAKYKIYMHQDVFITNQNFFVNILDIFQHNTDIGMLGMIGARKLPYSGVFFNSYDVGMVEVREPDMPYYCVAGNGDVSLTDVLGVDGVLIATQYDIRWREDLFKDFDFYDISQGLEFIKAGYRVAVPEQKKPWIIHDCGFAKLGKYEKNRQIFVNNYGEYLSYNSGSTFEYDGEWDELSAKLAGIIKVYISQGMWNEAGQVLDSYHQNKYRNSELEKQCIISAIYNAENTQENLEMLQRKFCKTGMTYEQLEDKYCRLRFAMRRYELGWEDKITSEFERQILQKEITIPAILSMLPHTTLYIQQLVKRLITLTEERNTMQYRENLNALLEYNRGKDISIAYGRRHK